MPKYKLAVHFWILIRMQDFRQVVQFAVQMHKHTRTACANRHLNAQLQTWSTFLVHNWMQSFRPVEKKKMLITFANAQLQTWSAFLHNWLQRRRKCTTKCKYHICKCTTECYTDQKCIFRMHNWIANHWTKMYFWMLRSAFSMYKRMPNFKPGLHLWRHNWMPNKGPKGLRDLVAEL